MNNIWRDLFFSLLIVLFVVLIISLIYYNKLSINRVIPESTDYLLSEKMQKDIEEDKLDEIDEVVTTYYLDASDLKKYEKNKEYQKGKVNPFKEISETISGSDGGDSNESNGFYKDDGTK